MSRKQKEDWQEGLLLTASVRVRVRAWVHG